MKNLNPICLVIAFCFFQTTLLAQNTITVIDAKTSNGKVFPVGNYTFKIQHLECFKDMVFKTQTGEREQRIIQSEVDSLIQVEGDFFFSGSNNDKQNIKGYRSIVVNCKNCDTTITTPVSSASNINRTVASQPLKVVVGNTWTDALTIQVILDSLRGKTILNSTQTETLNAIFKNYTGKTFTEYKKDTSNAYNNYFKNLLGNLNLTQDSSKSVKSTNQLKILADAHSGLPFLNNPTLAIDALGTLIAERFKEELTITFLAKFQKFLEDSTTRKWSLILPETRRVLKNINKEIYDFKPYLNTLHEAVQADTKELPHNLTTFLDSSATKYSHYQEVRVFLNLIESITKDNSPEKTFEKLLDTNFCKINFLDIPLKNNFIVSLLLLKNLRDENKWVSNTDFIKNQNAIPLFLGLTIEKERSKLSEVNLYNKIAKTPEIKKIEIWLGQAIELAELIKTSNTINTGADKQEKIVVYSKYILKHSDLLEHILKTDFLQKIDNQTINFIERGREAVKIVNNIALKNYSLAISNLVALLVDLRQGKKNNNNSTDKKLVQEQIQVQEKEDYLVFKYLTFAANLAKAENSADVKQALDAAALPVGSYRLKRNSNFSATINAYAGIYCGNENITKPDNTNSSATILAATAPVGINIGFCKNFGIFIPIVDLGSVATFRLTNTEAALPELIWSNVLSPGGYLVVNPWKNNPVTFMLGVQRGPELRRININDKAKTTAEFSTSAWRIGLSATFDIPLFNIYSK